MSSNLKTFFSKSLKLNNLKLNKLKPRYLKSLNNKAFSLIELLVVISIIGILAAIAIPSYSKYKEKAYHSVAKNRLLSMATTIQTNQALDLETTVDELRDFTINGEPAKDRPCVHVYSKKGSVQTNNKVLKDSDHWVLVYGSIDDSLPCGIEKGVTTCLDNNGKMFYKPKRVTDRCVGYSTYNSVSLN